MYSDSIGGGPIREFRNKFVQHRNEFFGFGDGEPLPDSINNHFDDLDRMHHEMMKHFSQFIGNESTLNEMSNFLPNGQSDLSIDQKDLEKL